MDLGVWIILEFDLWILDYGFNILDLGLWILCFGYLNCGCRLMGFRFCAMCVLFFDKGMCVGV